MHENAEAPTLLSISNSVDSLAIAVAKGFREVGHDIACLNTRVGSLEKRFDNLESNMATKDDVARLESHFESIEKIVFKDHAPRIRRIEHKLDIA